MASQTRAVRGHFNGLVTGAAVAVTSTTLEAEFSMLVTICDPRKTAQRTISRLEYKNILLISSACKYMWNELIRLSFEDTCYLYNKRLSTLPLKSQSFNGCPVPRKPPKDSGCGPPRANHMAFNH